MANMTADGMDLRAYRSGITVTVKPGDQVRLRNDMTGTVQCWTDGGVAVRLDVGIRPTTGGMKVWAVEATDGDIVRKL
jgi:hypothetical protein